MLRTIKWFDYFLKKTPAIIGVLGLVFALSCNTKSDRETSSETDRAGACANIRGGVEIESTAVKEENYPSIGIIVLELGAGQTGLCSGTLIAPNVILTAEHCVVDDDNEVLDPSNFTFKWSLDEDEEFEVKKVIPWDGGTHRDAALLVLKNSFDETYPYLPLMQGVLDREVGSSLSIVGFGGYTDASDIDTFDIGLKRKGEALFHGYTTDSSFGPTVDYIWLYPGGNNEEQIICQGDSGSPLVVEDGKHRMIGGVASLGGSVLPSGQSNTTEAICHYTVDALYVPSESIYDWTQEHLESEADHYEIPDASTLISGTIEEIKVEDGYSLVTFADMEVLDAGFNLGNETFELCESDCTPSIVYGSLDEGDEVLARLIQEDGRTIIQSIHSVDNARWAKDVGFSGVIKSLGKSEESMGRTFRRLKVKNVKAESSKMEKYIPSTAGVTEVIFCTDGCSKDVDIDKDVLVEDGEIFVVGDQIEGQGFFVRAYTNEDVCE